MLCGVKLLGIVLPRALHRDIGPGPLALYKESFTSSNFLLESGISVATEPFPSSGPFSAQSGHFLGYHIVYQVSCVVTCCAAAKWLEYMMMCVARSNVWQESKWFGIWVEIYKLEQASCREIGTY